MKQMVVQLCEVMMSAFVVFFCIQILFGMWRGNTMLGLAGSVAKQPLHQELFSGNGERLEEILRMPAPQVRVETSVHETGKKIFFLPRIQVRECADKEWQSVTEVQDYTVEVLDITDENGKSLGSEVFAEADSVSDEITAAVNYWKESGELYFFRSGCYVVKIKITGPYGRYAIKRITVPVEAG